MPVDLDSDYDYVLAGPDGNAFALADTILVDAAGDHRRGDAYASDNIQDKPGQIAVGLNPVTHLDFESDKNAYEVVLTGSEGTVQRDILTVEIVVMDVNEGPRHTRGSGGQSGDPRPGFRPARGGRFPPGGHLRLCGRSV